MKSVIFGNCVIQYDEFLVHVFSAGFVWQNEDNVLDNNANKFSKKYDVNGDKESL